MNSTHILMTGGSGLLGREILKLDSAIIAPTHADLDIEEYASVVRALKIYTPQIVLHLAAATKPPAHNDDPTLGIRTNIIGTANVARACIEAGVRLVYPSTDYVYTGPGPHREDEAVLPPYNFGWSKLGGECAAAVVPNHLILRLSFGPVPYPWEKVYESQYTSKLYVDEIAPVVLMAAQSDARGIMNIGGPRGTLEEYARRTVRGIKTIPKPEWVPGDTSLDLSRMRTELGIKDERKLLLHRD